MIKKLILLFLLMGTQVISAAELGEWAFKASYGRFIVQGGYSFVKVRSSREFSSTKINYISNLTKNDLLLEYGAGRTWAIGTSITYLYSAGEESFGDQIIYLKREKDDLYLKLALSFSPGDVAEDKFYSGGNSYQLSLGYQFFESLGAALIYSGEYVYKVEDDSQNYKQGASLTLKSFYELKYSEDSYGISGGYLLRESNKKEHEVISEKATYLNLDIYMNKKIKRIELLASLGFSKYLGEDDALEVTEGRLSLKLRKRF